MVYILELMPHPDADSLLAAWRLCRLVLGEDAAASRAAAIVAESGDDRVARVLAACRAVSAPPPVDAAARLRRALLALPPTVAAAVVLRVIEDLPLPAVAAALGVPRAVAAARVRAGLARLGAGAASALRDEAACPAPPSALLRARAPRRGPAFAAAAAAALALAAVAMPLPPAAKPIAHTAAIAEAEPTAFGLDLGEPPTSAADDGEAVDVQAWVFSGSDERFAEAGIDRAAARQVLPASALGRLQRAAAARELQAHALPIAATAAGGRAYLGSYRSVTLLHGDRPDLPARPARLGALVEGVIAVVGEGVEVRSLAAQHARLVGAAAPGGARIDVDRAPVSVVLRRARLEAAIALRPDQVLVLPLASIVQRPAQVVPASFDAEPALAPHQLVGDRADELAGDAAIVVLKAAPRASALDGEGDLAPSSLSMR